MADSAPEKGSSDVRIAAGRSPAYPYIDLEKAVRRAEQVRDAGAARQTLPPETFYKIWGIGPQSSGSRQTMAALNHFGLVDYVGRGDERKIKLSDLALKIVLDKQPGSQERGAALKAAALEPAIHAELYEKYGSFLPADVVMETYLVRDRGYNSQASSNLLEEYKATLSYAGLDKPDDMPPEELPKPGDNSMQPNPAETPKTPAPAGPPAAASTLGVGEREWLRGPLSRGVNYKLVVTGDMGPREIGKLIKLLEAQKAVLEDEDYDDI